MKTTGARKTDIHEIKFITQLSFVFAAAAVVSCSNGGCTAPLLLPEKPFFVVWNHPTTQCESKGIHLDFERWGIVDNTKDRFIGPEISLLYSGRVGKWPYYMSGAPVNGGLPQLGDLAGHLQKVEEGIKSFVPNSSFSGLGVIDFEKWRPLYSTNFDTLKIYQIKSLDLARQKFPQYNKTQLEAEATKEFESAARDFMGETLQKGRTLRPNGRWGYYGFPRCWDKNCNASTVPLNNMMRWIFNSSMGLYPSIYFNIDTAQSARATFVEHVIHETLRIKAKFAPQTATVFPYAMSQTGPYKLFQPEQLSSAILQPANMGSSGVVIWGSSSDSRAKNECLILQDYISSTLGPYTLNVTNFFGNCTEQLCHSHGRCVRRDYELVYQRYLKESGRKECIIPEKRLMKPNLISSRHKPYHNLEKRASKFLYSTFREFRHPPYAVTILWSLQAGHKSSIQSKLDFHLRFHKSTIDESEKLSEVMRNKQKFQELNNKGDASVHTIHDLPSKQQYRNGLRESRFLGKNYQDNLFKEDSQEIPTYDFDDYVCKCFPGWTGEHCESSVLE